MERYLYEAVFTPNSQGGYDAAFPDFGITTQGTSLADAAYMAQDLLTLYIAALREEDKQIAPVGPFDHNCPSGATLIGILALVNPNAPEVDTMSVQEAADLLGVSRSRVYAMVRDGVLRAHKIGHAQRVFTCDVRERFNNPRSAGRPRRRQPR